MFKNIFFLFLYSPIPSNIIFRIFIYTTIFAHSNWRTKSSSTQKMSIMYFQLPSTTIQSNGWSMVNDMLEKTLTNGSNIFHIFKILEWQLVSWTRSNRDTKHRLERSCLSLAWSRWKSLCRCLWQFSWPILSASYSSRFGSNWSRCPPCPAYQPPHSRPTDRTDVQ